ncbi:hypothetical protein [Brachybacterium tyrofermentans]|uniref:Uncharacterized protein n=1 Tax=Brachybacterium tyrofermentans TaxID=47848 RepID=A0ABW0FCQ3_9MICO|nr:hypothetical protein FM103_03030 [Corynebacterium xerosis]
MADWKTYAKAARNTAKKQAPGAREAAQRATSRAGGYARAASRALDQGRSSDDTLQPAARRADDRHRDDRSPDDRSRDDRPRDDGLGDHRSRADDRPRDEERRQPSTATRSSSPSAPRPAPRTETPTRSFRDEAKIYAVVASRTAERAGARAKKAGVGGRIARAVRDALLIGGSLLVIWGVLYAAGLPIPFSAVLIVVGIIVLIALASGLYAQFARDRQHSAADDLEDPDLPEERLPR